MAKLSKADYLKTYKRQLELSRKWRQTEGFDDLWARLIDLYKGKHFDSPMGSEDRIAVNIAFSTVNVIFPSISVNYPKFTVQPNRPEDTDRAIIVEHTTNYWWRHYDFQDPFRTAAKDYVILGHGWIKVAWKYREAEVAVSDEERAEEFERLRAEADAYAAENPDLAASVPTDEEIEGNVASFTTVAIEDGPIVERVSPFDMFVDPEATCMSDLGWIAQRVIRSLEEVRSDERYRRSARLKVQPDSIHKLHDGTDRARFGKRRSQDDLQRCTVWEFYDLKRNMLSVCADGVDEFLIDPQPIPFAFGHPFVMFRNYDVPDQFYPMGDLEQIECLQHELNKTRSQMMNHRKKFARKHLYRERAFNAQGRAALESDLDNQLVPVVDENTPLNELVVPLQQTPLPPEIYSHSQIIEDDIDQVSGVNEYARGNPQNIRRTATEAAIIQDAINARSADKLAQIESVLSKIGRRLVQVMQQYLQGEQFARVNGPDAKVFWFPYDRETIKGEFEFAVEAGSTQPTNEMFRRQQALSMVQTLSPFIGVYVNPVELIKEVLQKGFNVKNPARFLMQPPPPDPMGMGAEDPMAGAGMGSLQNVEAAPEGGESPVDGIPPEIAQQLAAQIGASF